MSIKRLLFLLCGFLCLSSPRLLFAGDITVLYTGSTHGMIYPCHCPIEPDGGVSRRATLFKELKNKYPNALVVDCGDFSAAGTQDEYTQNPPLDMQRTLVAFKAMEIMPYDAVAVGDDEFNFGPEFFNQNTANTKLKLVSCNLKEKNVLPYLIKDVSGVKTALIGLTDIAAARKSVAIKIEDPKISLRRTILEAKQKGAALIIVLSNIGESEDLKLLSETSGIDILIVGNAPLSGESSSKIGNTILLRASWEGRFVGKISFAWENNKVARFKVEDLRVSQQIKEDPDVLKILPRCFDDSFCKKEGFVGTCENAGNIHSQCIFKEAPRARLLVVTTADCITCNPGQVVKPLKDRFPGLRQTVLYYPDKKAQEVVKEFFISTLPAYLIGKEIERQDAFADIKDSLDDRGDFYVLKPQLSGIEYFLNREKIQGNFDAFLSLYDKDMSSLLDTLREFNPTIHFLARATESGFEAAYGDSETEEYLRSVCVQKYYPERFWDYLSCRAKNINSSWWEDCLGKLDTANIKACARAKEGASLLENNISLNRDLQIMLGPVYVLDNQKVFSSKGVPTKKELKKILKR